MKPLINPARAALFIFISGVLGGFFGSHTRLPPTRPAQPERSYPLRSTPSQEATPTPSSTEVSPPKEEPTLHQAPRECPPCKASPRSGLMLEARLRELLERDPPFFQQDQRAYLQEHLPGFAAEFQGVLPEDALTEGNLLILVRDYRRCEEAVSDGFAMQAHAFPESSNFSGASGQEIFEFWNSPRATEAQRVLEPYLKNANRGLLLSLSATFGPQTAQAYFEKNNLALLYAPPEGPPPVCWSDSF